MNVALQYAAPCLLLESGPLHFESCFVCDHWPMRFLPVPAAAIPLLLGASATICCHLVLLLLLAPTTSVAAFLVSLGLAQSRSTNDIPHNAAGVCRA